MTPAEYEKIVGQILDGYIDLDKLTELVTKERDRREEEEARKYELDIAKDKVIEDMLYYIGLVADDPDIDAYLDTPAARKDFENILTEMETMITLGLKYRQTVPKKVSQNELEDELRKWLAKKNLTNK